MTSSACIGAENFLLHAVAIGVNKILAVCKESLTLIWSRTTKTPANHW